MFKKIRTDETHMSYSFFQGFHAYEKSISEKSFGKRKAKSKETSEGCKSFQF